LHFIGTIMIIWLGGGGVFLKNHTEKKEIKKIAGHRKKKLLLKDHAQLFAKAIEVLTQPFVARYLDGRMLMCNHAFCEITGYTQKELGEMKQKYSLTPPDWIDYKAKMLEELHRTSLPQRFETEYLRKDGSRVPVELIVYLVRDTEGTPLYYYIFVNDITRRKQAEKALSSELEISTAIADLSEKILSLASIEDISATVLKHAQRLTESRHGYVGYIDRDTGYLNCSTLTRDIWDSCNVKGKNIVFKDFGDLGGWVVKNRKPILTNEPRQDPRSTGTPPGHIPIDRFLSVPAICNGTLFGVVALANSARDYNERDLNLVKRLAELFAIAVQRRWIGEDLRQSEEKYRNLFETMAQGVVYFDGEGKIISANPAAQEIFGLRLERILGRTTVYPSSEVIREDSSVFPEELHPSRIALKTGKEVKDVIMGVNNPEKKGYRWININAIPEFNTEECKPCQVYVTINDITERKLAEERLRSAHQRLLDIIESLPDATFVLDKDRTVIAWNQEMEDLTGTPKADILGKGDYAYALPLYGERRPVMIDLAFGEDKNIEAQYDYVKREGNILYAEAFLPLVRGGKGAYLWGKISRLLDKDGKLIGAIESIHDISKRKKAEEALVHERQRFETLTSKAPFGLVLVDREGNNKYVNPKFIEIFGYDIDDVPNNEAWFQKAYPEPEYRNMVLSMVRYDSENVLPEESIFKVTCKDGREKICRFTPVRLDTGEYLITCEDITQGKKLEEELLRIRKATDSTGNAIIMTDKKGVNVIYQNDSLVNLLGYTTEELVGGGAPRIYSSQDTAREVYVTIVSGRSWKGELELRTRDNRDIPVYLHGDAVRDETGDIVGIFGIYTDISERKLTEDKLQAANQQLMDIIDFLPDATFVIDRDGKVIAWNHAIEEMTGVRKDNILGKGDYAYAVPFYGEPRPILIDLIFPEDKYAELHYEFIERKESTIYGEALTPFLFNGEGAYLWGKASPLFDSEGKIIGAIESIRDITERKRTEEQLKYLSLHDPLTGLYNRTFFEDSMRRAGDGRFNPIGIIVCDVDGLKFINDTLGHDAGDSLLENVAAVIGGSFRQGDIVSRIGGDEFAILLIYSGEKTVEDACNRIRDAIKKYNDAGPEIPLSISLGFAVSTQADQGISELFKEADNNMYREKLHRSQSARSAIVQTLLKALEARDFITEGHAVRLQEFVTLLAGAIDLPKRNISDLNLLAKFHDIGKVGVSDNILFKPGTLNSEEAAEMRRHSEIGYRIAQSAPDLVPIAEWILKHHEWWNGKGYPMGLKREEIPLECRILAIADAYDAMTNDRPYRKAMTHEDAVIELNKCSGTQFDPHLVSKFVNVFSKAAGHK